METKASGRMDDDWSFLECVWSEGNIPTLLKSSGGFLFFDAGSYWRRKLKPRCDKTRSLSYRDSDGGQERLSYASGGEGEVGEAG